MNMREHAALLKQQNKKNRLKKRKTPNMAKRAACAASVISRHQNKKWPSATADEGLRTGETMHVY